MNTPPETSQRIPESLIAEAGVWAARLHSPQRTAQSDAGFKEWLRAHPDHARAFELISDVWDDAVYLPRVAYRRPTASRRTHAWTFAYAAGIVTVLLIGGLVLFQQPQYQTRIGEQRVLTLKDGSRVHMNTDTRLDVRYTEEARMVVLLQGEALFDVAQQAKSPFIVKAGANEIKALGTSFIVRFAADKTAVTLVEGKVAIGGIELTPGQRLIVSPHRPPQLDQTSIEQAAAWQRGQVSLNKTPLSEAVEEMNRYSETKIVIREPQASGLLISGLFQAGDIESFARGVALSYGLQVTKQSDQLILSGAP